MRQKLADSNWMIYGATGFTGRIIAQEAVRLGHKPVLAGRTAQKLAPLAEQLGLEWRVVDLQSQELLATALRGIELVFNAAGPFIHTADPLVRACLQNKVNYLDITGEIPVFQSLYERYDAQAREVGITVMPGAGFSVIPTDCLAQFLVEQLPDANSLELATFATSGGAVSAGAAKTVLEMFPLGGLVRRNGRLKSEQLGKRSRSFEFLGKPYVGVALPLGALETVYRHQGIPNITVYAAFPSGAATIMQTSAPLLQWLLKNKYLRDFIQKLVERLLPSGEQAQPGPGQSFVWGQVTNEKGEKLQAWYELIEEYRFTALGGIRAVERTLELRPSGVLSPAAAFGAGFALEIEGTSLEKVTAPTLVTVKN
jgi:short subunit dehydrogenase-like uncharacterized protein